jgi:hypothetical protein
MDETSFQDALFATDTEPTPYVLTVKQPWAWAIIHAGKDVENRSRPVNYRGKLLIQAGKSYAPEGDKYLRDLGITPPADLPRGCIIGSVEVVGSTSRSTSEWAMDGYQHWLLADPKPAAQLLPCRGSLSMFRAPEGWEQAFTSPSGA